MHPPRSYTQTFEEERKIHGEKLILERKSWEIENHFKIPGSVLHDLQEYIASVRKRTGMPSSTGGGRVEKRSG